MDDASATSDDVTVAVGTLRGTGADTDGLWGGSDVIGTCDDIDGNCDVMLEASCDVTWAAFSAAETAALRGLYLGDGLGLYGPLGRLPMWA